MTKSPITPLIRLIEQAIYQQGVSISFAEFMALALYSPLGYYQNDTLKFGRQGDFITAPLVSPLFGQCIANQIAAIFPHLEEKNILEFGAGTGHLARDILLQLEKQNSLPDHYYILEISDTLRERQKNFLTENIPHLINRIEWLTEMKTMRGVVIANEVLDALPFHCFSVENKKYFERCVGYKDQQFVWMNQPIDATLNDALTQISETVIFPEKYASEINLGLTDFIKNISHNLTQGVVLFLDYGYGRAEYYHPERKQGTLTCFHHHQKNDNPFLNIGEQDITAHIDFTAVIEAAVNAEFSLKGFTTQAAFLLSSGLTDLAPLQIETPSDYQQNQAIKILTMPSEMGEVIKVMALGKNYPEPLLGFTFNDRTRDL